MFVRTIGVRVQIEMGEFVRVEHESIVVVEAGGLPQVLWRRTITAISTQVWRSALDDWFQGVGGQWWRVRRNRGGPPRRAVRCFTVPSRLEVSGPPPPPPPGWGRALLHPGADQLLNADGSAATNARSRWRRNSIRSAHHSMSSAGSGEMQLVAHQECPVEVVAPAVERSTIERSRVERSAVGRFTSESVRRSTTHADEGPRGHGRARVESEHMVLWFPLPPRPTCNRSLVPDSLVPTDRTTTITTSSSRLRGTP